MCQEYVAKFESSVVELSQVNEYLESNIALAERFKDAVSFPRLDFYNCNPQNRSANGKG